MIKRKKKNWSLLRLIISIADFIWCCLKEKTILSVSILIIVVVVPPIVIPRVTSEDPPTLPSEGAVNPEVQVKNSKELTPEEPKEIQKGVESETQRTENRHISEELKDIRERVKSGTQRDEDMYQRVKAMNEDARNMSEKVKKMNEKVDGQSEN